MIAIIITAYNRSEPLKSLLTSLLKIRPCGEIIPLVISIDNQGTPEVNKIANDFKWPFGEKEVIIHQQKKGLVKHFIWTGDQTELFDHIIFLEDDLIVSPEIINYTKQMIEFYDNDDRVAAASLYNPVFNEATGTRFYQLQDEYDSYFLQQPYWGHVWFRNKWKYFHEFLKNYQVNNEALPPSIATWTKSFKKIFIQFLIETNRTVVTPRVSVVSNNGVVGLHSDDGLYHWQNILQLEFKFYKFPTIDCSNAIYDSFLEIDSKILKKYNNALSNYQFDVDLFGTKKKYYNNYVLTIKKSKNILLSFTSLMKPTELGIVLDQKGDNSVVLTKQEDITEERKFYRRRRYLDLKKNYYLGVLASWYVTKDLFHLFWKRVVLRKK